MSLNIGVIGAKGGVGTSTIAALLFMAAHNRGSRAVLVTDEDGFSILGLPLSEPVAYLEDRSTVVLASAFPKKRCTGEVIIYDGQYSDYTVLVTRPCYLALARAVRNSMVTDSVKGIVVINELGRALDAGDAARALGVPVLAELPDSPMICRAIDAGLMGVRVPADAKPITALLETITADYSASMASS